MTRIHRRGKRLACALLIPVVAVPASGRAQDRPRARDVGIVVGELPTGPLNAITDVGGVQVGHYTLIQGDSIRTGVTTILPHGGNLYRDRVRAAIAVGNGFGKLVGLSQVNELGEIETPILLTGTLSVFRVADALLDTLLSAPGNEGVRSMNPVVGETNDGYLSDIRARPIRPGHVRAALRAARAGAVEEGSVGAGTGTRALGWKGGIGTASRLVSESHGSYTVGVLVQTNFGGTLRINGVAVGAVLEGSRYRDAGSVMIVLATDAPLNQRELERLAYRAFLGIGRTGSYMAHGSGDYAIAFSSSRDAATVDGSALTSLFQAAVEATEEAVINSLFKARGMSGFRGRRVEALPIQPTLELLRRRGLLTPPGAEGSG